VSCDVVLRRGHLLVIAARTPLAPGKSAQLRLAKQKLRDAFEKIKSIRMNLGHTIQSYRSFMKLVVEVVNIVTSLSTRK
jgi:hypothetical protein